MKISVPRPWAVSRVSIISLICDVGQKTRPACGLRGAAEPEDRPVRLFPKTGVSSTPSTHKQSNGSMLDGAGATSSLYTVAKLLARAGVFPRGQQWWLATYMAVETRRCRQTM